VIEFLAENLLDTSLDVVEWNVGDLSNRRIWSAIQGNWNYFRLEIWVKHKIVAKLYFINSHWRCFKASKTKLRFKGFDMNASKPLSPQFNWSLMSL
jgi:hypothetical protein